MPLLPASAQGTIAGAPEVVYKALADYDSWQEWVPSLASARLLTREDRLAIVELNPGGKEAESLMLECIETPGKSVLARVIEGMAPIRELEWSVEPADPGFSRVRLTVKRGIGLRLLHPSRTQPGRMSRGPQKVDIRVESRPGGRCGRRESL
jgi:hypothetical protein